MSPNPIEIYFKENFDKTLEELKIAKSDNLEFCIYPTSQIEKYTNFDDIYRMWVTPNFKGIRISYNEVIQNLVKTQKNTIPLWIKILNNQKGILILEISQRFRTRKQVIERNPENPIAPFEIVKKSEFEFNISEEREEAIRILLFKRLIDENLKAIIGKTISYDEFNKALRLNFDSYRFYPPLYNHFKQDDERFSKLVIEKDFNSGQFRIFSSNEKEDSIAENLDYNSVINYYIHNELNWEYKGIKIETELHK